MDMPPVVVQKVTAPFALASPYLDVFLFLFQLAAFYFFALNRCECEYVFLLSEPVNKNIGDGLAVVSDKIQKLQ